MSAFKNPYPYQERVAQYLLVGKSVILQAPTGAGKTAASLLPFLYARQNLEPDRFPRKCIYSVPMRVLANQFVEEHRKIIQGYGWQRELSVKIHTGDRPDDPQVEGDLVFTTIDQTLSNFLNIPYSLGTRLANLNAGAVLSSYLVFDELHLYDPDTMLPTTLEMLLMLKEITPFVIMTATFSSAMLQRLAALLDAVVVPEDDAARQGMTQIGAQIGKERCFYFTDSPLTAEHVLLRQGRRVICICNTVSSAQRLYQELQAALVNQNNKETQLCLLHSRFYKADRDEKEDWVRTQFGIGQAEYDGPPLIVVATQVIEVGVDATSDVLHTELAPASSLLQRAGRCARRENEKGEVYVYLPRTDEEEPYFAPYFLKSQPRATERGRRLCEATWAALLSGQFTGRHMDFTLEQAFINTVHTPIDEEIIQVVSHIRYRRREDMLRSMREIERGLAGELIRNINNRFVFVHPSPHQDEKLAKNPWAYDGFGLYPGMLAGEFDRLSKEITDFETTPWMMRTAVAVSGQDAGGEEAQAQANQPTVYSWRHILTEGKEVFGTAVIAVHPTLVKYDKELGFRFELSSGQHVSPERKKQSQWKQYSYELETYAEHIAGLYRAYRQSLYDWENKVWWLPLQEEVAYTFRRLEENPEFNLIPGSIDQVVRALFACHDLGKLNVAWQKWAHKWQAQVGQFYGGVDMGLPADYMAAHTKFEPTQAQKDVQRALGRRPNHAGESAIAGARVLQSLCNNNKPLLKASFTAIARHHSAQTSEYQRYKIHHKGNEAIVEALQEVGLPSDLCQQVLYESDGFLAFSRYLVDFDPSTTEEFLLYFLLVRVLRLADQRSQVK